jgi:hypothetical protein
MRNLKRGITIIIIIIIAEIPEDRNVIKKEAHRIIKYKDLITEIQCMLNVEAKEIQVPTGVTEITSESLGQYLRYIPGKHKITELQKTNILSTAHILCKVLV